MSQQWAERNPPQGTSLMENWNGQLKHWLFKLGEIKTWRAGLLYTIKVYSQRGVWLKEWPYSIEFSWWVWGRGYGMTVQFLPREKNAGVITILFSFFPISYQLFSPAWCSGYQDQGCKYKCWKWIIFKQETNSNLKFGVKVPKCLVGYVVLSFHLAKLRSTVTVSLLPGGRNSPVVLYLCNLTLNEWVGWRGGTC